MEQVSNEQVLSMCVIIFCKQEKTASGLFIVSKKFNGRKSKYNNNDSDNSLCMC